MSDQKLFFVDNVGDNKNFLTPNSNKGIITKDEEDHFKTKYLEFADNPPLLTTKIDDTDKLVEGFSFPIHEVLIALGIDPDSVQTSNKGIHLGFGYNDGSIKDDEGNVKGKIGIAMILYGLNADLKIVREEGKMFDYSKPCPRNCPRNDDFQLPSSGEE